MQDINLWALLNHKPGERVSPLICMARMKTPGRRTASCSQRLSSSLSLSLSLWSMSLRPRACRDLKSVSLRFNWTWCGCESRTCCRAQPISWDWANVKSFQSFPFNLTSDVNGILIQHAGRWVNALLCRQHGRKVLSERSEHGVKGIMQIHIKRKSSSKCLYANFTLSTAPSYVPILAWQPWKWKNAFKQKNKRHRVDRQNTAWGILTSLVKMFCST